MTLNDRSQVVGFSYIGVVPGSEWGTLQKQAFLYENGAMQALGLHPSFPAELHSTAAACPSSRAQRRPTHARERPPTTAHKRAEV